MSVRWLLFDYVDPDLRLDRAQRKAVRRRAWNTMHMGVESRRPRFAAKAPQVLAALIPGAVMLLVFATVQFTRSSPLMGFVAIPIQVIITWLLMAWLGKLTWRPWVLQAMSELGHSVCDRCGYSRHGLDESVTACPECGTPFQSDATA